MSERPTPSDALLKSMALRYDHGFGLLTDERRREGILSTMRQLWEEVAGVGFYRGDDTIVALKTDLNRAQEALEERDLLREEVTAWRERFYQMEYRRADDCIDRKWDHR